MSYAISTEIEQGYIKLIVSGEQTSENNKELVFRVLQACLENNVRKALIDLRETSGQPGTLSDYELASIAAREGLGLVNKVAMVSRPENIDYASFFETAIRNRGINLLTFSEEDEAIQWLLEA